MTRRARARRLRLGLLLHAALAAVLLGACAGGPKPAEWTVEAAAALQRADEAHLRGEGRLEAAEMARLRGALASSGRTDLRARAELAHCAARVASLQGLEAPDPCPAMAPWRDDAGPAEVAYAGYLAGQATAASVPLLPQAQRAVAMSRVDARALQAIGDPLGRMVAAAVAWRTQRLADDAVDVAVDTAAAQGWRRALLAWLQVQRQRADAAGRADVSARVQRRIDLVRGLPERP